MQNNIGKCLVPCGIVAVCTVLPLVLAMAPKPAMDIQSIVDELQSVPDPSDAEIRLNQYISFLERITNSGDLASLQSINAIRFEAAETLAERDDPLGYSAALKQYEMINQNNPSYNHGWLQFLLADTYQKLNEWDESAIAYAQVPFYNHSRLALRAKFLESMIRSEQLNQPASSESVYYYLRFASEYPVSDAALSSNWQWNEGENNNYIQALAQFDAGNNEEAIRLMPMDDHDPSTVYYRNVFESPALLPFPKIYNLLQSAYYNGSVVSGSVMMHEGYSLLADFYRMESNSSKLELHYSHADNFIPSFEVFLNQSKIDTIDHRPDLNAAYVDCIPQKGKNIIEIRWYQTGQQGYPTSSLTVHVHELKVQ